MAEKLAHTLTEKLASTLAECRNRTSHLEESMKRTSHLQDMIYNYMKRVSQVEENIESLLEISRDSRNDLDSRLMKLEKLENKPLSTEDSESAIITQKFNAFAALTKNKRIQRSITSEREELPKRMRTTENAPVRTNAARKTAENTPPSATPVRTNAARKTAPVAKRVNLARLAKTKKQS